jgi:hypothetical protein
MQRRRASARLLHPGAPPSLAARASKMLAFPGVVRVRPLMLPWTPPGSAAIPGGYYTLGVAETHVFLLEFIMHDRAFLVWM